MKGEKVPLCGRGNFPDDDSIGVRIDAQYTTTQAEPVAAHLLATYYVIIVGWVLMIEHQIWPIFDEMGI